MALAFYCKQCGNEFAIIYNLSRHLKFHNQKIWIFCQYCTFSTKRKDSLKRHSSKYHDGNKMGKKDFESPVPILSVNSNMESTQFLSSTRVAPLYNLSGVFDQRLQLPLNFVYAGDVPTRGYWPFTRTIETESWNFVDLCNQKIRYPLQIKQFIL